MMTGWALRSAIVVNHCSSPACDGDRKSTRLNSSHLVISYAVFCLKKKNDTEHYSEPLGTACFMFRPCPPKQFRASTAYAAFLYRQGALQTVAHPCTLP